MKIWIDYVNHRGVRNPERPIYPMSIRFGTSNWHKAPQWLMDAVDTSTAERREFAMRDMAMARPSPTWLIFALGTIRGIVTRLEEIARMHATTGNTTTNEAKRLAEECLKEFSKNRMDEPAEYPAPHRLYVPPTDVFSMPEGISRALGTHPAVAIKWAYMAMAAGVNLPEKYEEQLAYIQWQALQAWLEAGPDGFDAAMQRRWDTLHAKALENSRAKFEGMETSKYDEDGSPDEKVMRDLAIMKNNSQAVRDNEAKLALLQAEAGRIATAKLLGIPSPMDNATNQAIDRAPAEFLRDLNDKLAGEE